jgi:hypothetical protein
MSFHRIPYYYLPRVSGILLLALSATCANADTIAEPAADLAPVTSVADNPALAADKVADAPASVIIDQQHGAQVAQSASTAAATVSAEATTLATTATPVASMEVAGLGAALDPAMLEDQRGGSDLGPTQPLSGIFTTGAVGDNRAVDVATGSNAIRDGAFTNASGIPVVIQNTGANVLIQNATVVNVQLH